MKDLPESMQLRVRTMHPVEQSLLVVLSEDLSPAAPGRSVKT